ncbi:MAG TPA: hypothetical protein VFR36_03235 [Sphingomicrobium sp.]|nr:hypothetical protein [Sphingomicrobium sp.]
MGTIRHALLLAASVCGLCGSADAAWHEAKSKHFIIYADLKPAELKAYAERLERFDRAVRVLRGMEDVPLTDSQRLTVYALQSENAVARLGGMATAKGFYSASASGAMAFVPRKVSSTTASWYLETEMIFFHEYAHHLQLQFSSFAIPPWMVEGFAEFFATAKLEKDGNVLIGAPPQYRGYALFNETGLRLDQIVGATYEKLDDHQTDLLYGMGWLLTHYLTFEPSRKGQIKQYIDAIQKGTSPADAAKAAFGDLRQLDRELAKYKRGKFPAVRITGASLATGPIDVRQLGAGEAAIMDVHMRSRRGVNSKTAPPVAADARKAAAPYPSDPFVQTALAEAEFDSGNYAAADAAADRALAADPKYVRAMIYKGKAQMELAKKDPKPDWAKVRSWFIRANKLDTENAEPLMLYFRSFVEADERPTKNAIDALMYAATLAPQDDSLRLQAVYQMLREDRISEAKALFAPLAYLPHASEKFRDTSGKVMAAMAVGDGKAALAVLDSVMKSAEEETKKP